MFPVARDASLKDIAWFTALPSPLLRANRRGHAHPPHAADNARAARASTAMQRRDVLGAVGRRQRRINAAPLRRLRAEHNRPTNVLRIRQYSRLECLMFTGFMNRVSDSTCAEFFRAQHQARLPFLQTISIVIPSPAHRQRFSQRAPVSSKQSLRRR